MFPGYPLVDKLVSKQFYNEATAVWFRTTVVSFDAMVDMVEYLPLNRASLSSKITQLHTDWTIDMGVEMWNSVLESCSNLRHLQLTMSPSAFPEAVDKVTCVDDFGPDDFASRNGVKAFTAQRNLKHVVIDAEEDCYADTDEEQQ